MRINYEIAELVAFVAVAERLSYVDASEELNISRSSLSRRIQNLEMALECRLFERTSREVKLTIAGKHLLSRARDIIETLTEVQVSFKGQPQRRSSTLTIACVPSIIRQMLPTIQERVLAVHPYARIRIFDISSNEVVQTVKEEQADLGIAYLGDVEPGLISNQLGIEEFVLAVPRDHVFAERAELKWSELAEHRIIGPRRESGIRMLLESALAKAAVDMPWFHEVRHTDTALLMTEAGIGMTPVPKSILEGHGSDRLVGVPLIDPCVTRSIAIIKKHGQPLRPLAQVLWDTLVETTDITATG